MNLEKMIESLNSDLSNELKHLHFYLFSSSNVTGINRLEVREFLEKQAKSEMEHVKAFQDVIIGLDGVPTTQINFFPKLTLASEILNYALEMETEVVNNYFDRLNQADALGGVDGRFLVIFLEEQMQDSRMDLDNIKQIMR